MLPAAPVSRQSAIVALVSDLVFASKITATAAHLDLPVEIVRRCDAVALAAASGQPVLLDLTVEDSSAVELIRTLKQQHPQRTVIGFLPHVQTELARLARSAGADRVLPRSAFTRQLPEILRELSRPASLAQADATPPATLIESRDL